tara:strand:+ start:566 stop:763 length:198 start_codon:yes stop_codon:yes gene_type:complete
MQSDLYFDCDICESKFTIGFGFLGSKKDFDLYILNKNETQDENGIECSPQMELISLCEACKNKVK